MINPCFYYYLIKPEPLELFLNARPRGTSKGFQLTVEDKDKNEKNGIWMIHPSEKADLYHIYHCLSGLVLEVGKENTVQLHHFKNRDSQKFRLSVISTENEEYSISDYSKSAAIFIKENKLVNQLTSGQIDATWIIRRAKKDKILYESAIIQNQNSGYVLQVSENAEKEFGKLEQASWQGMFCQRWVIQKQKQFYLLRNLKSGFVATVKSQKSKEGGQIVQEKDQQNQNRYQLWSIEPRGYRLYSIRLASQKEFFLGVKNFSKEHSDIILLPEQNKHLWKIMAPNF